MMVLMNHQNRCSFPGLRLFVLNDLHLSKPLYIQQAPSIVLHIKETENHLFHKKLSGTCFLSPQFSAENQPEEHSFSHCYLLG